MVSGRQVTAHPDGNQHDVPIQISPLINLGKTFPCISSIWKIVVTWILARVFAHLPAFFSQILDLIYKTVLIFILIYSEWHDTENQQFASKWKYEKLAAHGSRSPKFLENSHFMTKSKLKFSSVKTAKKKKKQQQQQQQIQEETKKEKKIGADICVLNQ